MGGTLAFANRRPPPSRLPCSRGDRLAVLDPIRAGKVYVTHRVLAEPRARARAERLAELIDAPIKETIEDSKVEAIRRSVVREELSRRGRDQGGFDHRTVILDLMQWERSGSIIPGYSWAELRNAKQQSLRGVLCQTAVEIQTIVGCGFDCNYCPYTAAITVTCDLERFMEELEALFDKRPQQLLYKLNNRSDTLCFEPEYGLSKLLVERFSHEASRVLMLYSKSNNVSHLLDLEHKGRTIFCSTLSMASVAARLEPSAPSLEARIDAAAQCAAAGYPVRFRFSPLVPLRGWRQELVETVRKMAERVTPELITLWTLSMVPFEELDRIVSLDALDPEALELAREHKEAMAGEKGAPFPESFRAEMYEVAADAIARYSPTTRVALCLETPPVVKQLLPSLAVVGNQQVCNCGPRCTPAQVALANGPADPAPRSDVLNEG